MIARSRPAGRIVCGALAAACILAGCELMVAPSASPRPSREISTPAPTPAPTPIEVDEFETLPPDDATPQPDDLTTAAEALADLDSYRVIVTTRGIVPATPADGTVSMTSTLVQGPEPAARFALTGADGFAGGRLDAIVIADRAWLREGGGRWRESPGGAADFDAAFTAMSPAQLLVPFDVLSPLLTRVATERRNGVRSEHLHGDASNLGFGDAGLVEGSIDVWRATSGGYLVALDLDGKWLDDDGAPVRTTLRIEVSHVNDAANRVSPP